MSWKRGIRWCGVAFAFACLASCQVKRPGDVLSDEQMEAVLYDYHVAKALSDQLSYTENYKRVLYIESVFRKHGITEAQFDTSLVWFSRHPEAFGTVYEKVNARLKAAKDQVEDLIALRDNKPKESQPGDSIDVWAWEPVYRLTGMPYDNRVWFELPSDPNFMERDTLRWNVRFHFIGGDTAAVRDSLYAPVMGMQVHYAKDTLLYDIRPILRSGWESLSVSADTLGQIEKVSGFIYYPRQSSGRILLADSVSLMRYHARTDTTQIGVDTAAVAAKKPVASRTLQSSAATRLKANP